MLTCIKENRIVKKYDAIRRVIEFYAKKINPVYLNFNIGNTSQDNSRKMIQAVNQFGFAVESKESASIRLSVKVQC